MKTKKRFWSLMLAALMLLGLLSGCGTESAPAETTGEASAETGMGSLVSFEAETLDGSEFTPETIAAADLTVMNLWQTTCPPCIQEMPELAELEKGLPDRVRFVTWCLDGDTETDTVRSILTEAGYEGTTLISGGGDLMSMLMNIQYTPTTIFISSTGEIIGEPVVGAYEDPVTMYREKINEILGQLGKPELDA